MDVKQKYSGRIKDKALEIGFDACGISGVEELVEEKQHLRNWLNNRYHGEMHYMENHFEKRCDPGKLVTGAKSVISVILNYFPEQSRQNTNDPIVSKYAYGEDYHFVMRRMLERLLDFMREIMGPVEGRVFVDSAPVLEKAWAVRAGLGWIGKNGMFISKKYGSFVFLGEVIADIELEYDRPFTQNFCGNCTKCLDACPTKALVQPGVVAGNRCISYFTIEKRGAIPEKWKGKFRNRLFGCDICQDVCPWNKAVKPNKIKAFQPSGDFPRMSREDWYNLTEEEFNRRFKKSAMKRTGYSGLMRNLKFVQ